MQMAAPQPLALLEPEPEPESVGDAPSSAAPVASLPGQLAPLEPPGATAARHRSAKHAAAFGRGLAQLAAEDPATQRRAAEWLRDCANESRETQQALRDSAALTLVAARLREIAPEMPAEERKGRVRWRLAEARARIQKRQRRQALVSAHVHLPSHLDLHGEPR